MDKWQGGGPALVAAAAIPEARRTQAHAEVRLGAASGTRSLCKIFSNKALNGLSAIEGRGALEQWKERLFSVRNRP
jgi:hypothetical protein